MKSDSAACSIPGARIAGAQPKAASRAPAKTKTILLKRGEVIRLEQNTGVGNIEAKNGIVWLTGTPANGDVLLRNGGQMALQGDWPYVVEALEEAELLLVFIL